MKYARKLTVVPTLILASALLFNAGAAHAQSTEGVLGGLIGGTLGSVVGGKLDNKGSSSEGKVIGAVVGGSLGYVIGDGLDDDDKLNNRYSNQPGTYYKHNGKSYRRYNDNQYGYVSIPINSNDRYYHANGKRKNSRSHPHRRSHHSKSRRTGYY